MGAAVCVGLVLVAPLVGASVQGSRLDVGSLGASSCAADVEGGSVAVPVVRSVVVDAIGTSSRVLDVLLWDVGVVAEAVDRSVLEMLPSETLVVAGSGIGGGSDGADGSCIHVVGEASVVVPMARSVVDTIGAGSRVLDVLPWSVCVVADAVDGAVLDMRPSATLVVAGSRVGGDTDGADSSCVDVVGGISVVVLMARRVVVDAIGAGSRVLDVLRSGLCIVVDIEGRVLDQLPSALLVVAGS